MNLQRILGMVVSLLKGRFNDLEARDQMFRDLSSRIDHQNEIIGVLVDLQSDCFSGNQDVLDKLAKIIEADDFGNEITRILDHDQFERDQMAAMIAEFEELLKRQTDENRQVPE